MVFLPSMPMIIICSMEVTFFSKLDIEISFVNLTLVYGLPLIFVSTLE